MIRVIDFESTGFPGEGQTVGIVQIGMIELNSDFGEQRRFETLVNPDIPLEHWQKGAVECSRITPKIVANAPLFCDIFDEFAVKMVGGLYWVGYNTPFDRRMLKSQLHRYDLEDRFPWPPRELDMLPECGRHLGTKPGSRNGRWKLVEAYEKIVGKPLEDAHNALVDCRAVVEIMRSICDPKRFNPRFKFIERTVNFTEVNNSTYREMPWTIQKGDAVTFSDGHAPMTIVDTPWPQPKIKD